MNYFDVSTKQHRSGLLIPSAADIESANQKIAENYRRDAITQASKLLDELGPVEIASFLWVKNTTCDVIAEGN